MTHLLWGLTGSVATIKAPLLALEWYKIGWQAQAVFTEAARYFLDERSFEDVRSQCARLWEDRDEWPGAVYTRGQEIPHIQLRDWCDLLVIAPLDAQTLAKIALGLSDNLLTSLLRAWDRRKPILVAPAMNTHMWYHPLTVRHLATWASFFLHPEEMRAKAQEWESLGIDRLVQQLAQNDFPLRVVSPTTKVLACGEEGMGAMADVGVIRQKAEALMSQCGHSHKGD